jgi:hypothetical protein
MLIGSPVVNFSTVSAMCARPNHDIQRQTAVKAISLHPIKGGDA